MANNIFFQFGGRLWVGPECENDLKVKGVIFMEGGKNWFYNLNKIKIIF